MPDYANICNTNLIMIFNTMEYVMLVNVFSPRLPNVVGDVLFSTKTSSPYDLALVQLRDSVKEAVIPQMSQTFNPGLMPFLFIRDSSIVALHTCSCSKTTCFFCLQVIL